MKSQLGWVFVVSKAPDNINDRIVHGEDRSFMAAGYKTNITGAPSSLALTGSFF